MLRDVYDNSSASNVDEDCSPTKVCRNARDFTFEGIAEDPDEVFRQSKRFSECSDEELAAVRRMIASAALATRERVRPPHRGSSVR